MRANEVLPDMAAFSHRIERTNDFKPTITKTHACGNRGHGPLLQAAITAPPDTAETLRL